MFLLTTQAIKALHRSPARRPVQRLLQRSTAVLCVLALTSSLLPAGLPLSLAAAQAQSSPSRAKEFIAILDFEAKGGISKDEASIITDRVRAQMMRSGQFQIMERAKMQEIIKEQSFQQSDLCDTTECSVELGRLLAVNRILTGSVSKFGDMYTLTARLMDVEKGNIIFEEFEDCDCRLEDLLTRSTAALVVKLLSNVDPGRQPAPTPTPVPTPTSAPTSIPQPQGRISISSTPAGATVFWNNRNMGTTPLTLSAQVPGPYSLRLSASGYNEHQQQVRINADENTLNITLDPASEDNNGWIWGAALGGLAAVAAVVGVLIVSGRSSGSSTGTGIVVTW